MGKTSELLSEYIRTETVRMSGPVQHQIRDYEQAELKDAKTDRIDTKWVLILKDTKPRLLLNKENTRTLIDAFGDEMDGWIGKTIEVYVDESVKFGSTRTGGLRVRVPAVEATR